MRRSLLFCGALLASLCAWAEPAQVRLLSSDFVLPGKHQRLAGWAREAGVELRGLRLGIGEAPPGEWLDGGNLLILDTPRPTDRAQVEEALGERLQGGTQPWIRVGGGPPGFGNLPAALGGRLVGYYANGGEANLRRLFEAVRRWHAGLPVDALPAPQPLAQAGFYHPDAPAPFAGLADYLAWGASRWASDAPRIAFLIPRGAIADAQTGAIDELLRRSERHGQAPLAVWFDDSDPEALRKSFVGADVQALVNLQHLQNGPARRAEFLALDVPVLQTLGYRDGNEADWLAAASGVASRTAAAFLGMPETWGMSDPLVISALENGEPKLMAGQAEALLDKLDRLLRLRRLPAADKHLALMFWNHPEGEKNVAASHLNVPASLARLGEALRAAGYRVATSDESALIDTAQRLLGGYYRPQTLDALYRDGLAASLPLDAYLHWFEALPADLREEMRARWGDPRRHWALRDIDGQRRFVFPAARLGNLLLLPQPPRAGRPGEAYHDSAVPPDHLFLAVYQFVREGFGADALIHFGTHGTQEWLPGKDRGLAVGDYPLRALGDLPVFYPYIQDNVGEAIQARRRGRAVTVSHQTPSFAPAGLYDELRDLHQLIHEYQQLDEGAVRERSAEQIRAAVRAAHMNDDLGWSEAAMREDFPAFLGVLHDHLHRLAGSAMPLGLHTFGVAASPELRLGTVMQQLGEPYYRALGLDPDELFAADFRALREGRAYRTLQRYLRDGGEIAKVADPRLREQLLRARELDRQLADTGELEALLAGLAGRFVAPGPGGDPIRNPQVPSGRNLFAFEADKVPTRAAYEAGAEAFGQLLESYRAEHQGRAPEKLAFSLWSSETMRHLGIVESQALHALGLRPRWDAGGRLLALDIVPAAELGRPRVDVVLQVTSVYRDQFDGFMRLLAEAIERLAALDEPGNPLARNSQALERRLRERGVEAPLAQRLSRLRLFGNAPGDYGTGVTQLTLDSTRWDDDSALAEQFLGRLQYAYGSRDWGVKLDGGNLFAEQLKGVQAAILSRSSTLNGVLSTDHPFEYLGGLSLAVRHLDGASPALYIADLRQRQPRTTAAAQFLASELRGRYLSPQWIAAMQREGYAGSLEMLDLANNLWGWQAADRTMVRADQWQALHDTFVMDRRELGLAEWFETHNPTAQAQIIARMAEAIRKGYWDASEQTRRELAERWRQLAAAGAGEVGTATTREFIERMAGGFGEAAAQAEGAAASGAGETVSGRVLEEVAPPPSGEPQPWLRLAAAVLLALFAAGAVRQSVVNRRPMENRS
ncbi:TPA: cobaltochelatase subunit CobN [Pseudomonas aeruginosa]